MACVWTQTAAGPRFYLPGSSLRGVLRSAAERLVACWQPNWGYVSDPFNNASEGWVQRQREREPSPSSADIYRMAGPIERCFGHTALRGRWTFGDAWMRNERDAHIVVRDGVGISRRTGAAMNDIKFQFEAITGGVFETTLTIVNYELWQLGLLAHALALLDGGQARLGYGTYRGMGRIRLAVTMMDWRWYGYLPSENAEGVRLPPLEQLATLAGLDDSYGWRDKGQAIVLPLVPNATTFGSAWRLEPARGMALDGFASTDWDGLPWPQLAELLAPTLNRWSLPDELQPWLPEAEVRQ
ncbi:MAG: hypothetical protein IPO81_00590 [Kouleothrix sp.]|nr:hypothetical protein [Kouleothrix sp.]